MRGLHVLIGIGLVAALASPAAASPSRDYAVCVARVRPADVNRLLDAKTESQGRNAFRAASTNEYCFARTFGAGSYQPDDVLSIGILRGIFAEQALLRDGHAAVPAAVQVQSQTYIRPWFAATGRAPAVDEMAVCMADTDPASIMGLMRTQAGSWDEQAWMGTLPASLSRCLRAGMHLDANRAALRAALADALYQRMHAQPSAVASSR